MSVTIAHRPHLHVHVPWTAIAVLIAAAALAAVIVFPVEQPWETGRVSGTATTTTTAAEQAVAVPKPATQAELRAYARAAEAADEAAAGAATTRLSLVEGITLDAPGTYVLQPPAPYYPPGSPGIDNAHPLNFVAGTAR